MITGYLVSFDGCPWIFGSASVTSLPTCTDDDWSTDWTLVSDAIDLEHSRLSWDETLDPIEADLSVGAITVALHDVIGVTDVPDGRGTTSWASRAYPMGAGS
jgi:hypothetical protein